MISKSNVNQMFSFASYNITRNCPVHHTHSHSTTLATDLCLSWPCQGYLHEMMFKLDFDAFSSYFVKKEISYLKKYIPCSQTALVSCKNIV